MQSYLKYKEYYDRKAKVSPLEQNDYCFILQPIADHQGSKIPFREFRWIGPYIIEQVLPNENYFVRKLNSNKTQILHRIRLRKYEPNVPLRDERPEGNLQLDEEIVPQDDLYVITWETNFGDLQIDHRNETYDQNNERTTNSSDATEALEQPGQILTDVDLRSTERTATDEIFPKPISQKDDAQSFHDDKTSSGGSDTIVPEVLESENDDMIVENESPRGGKYNLRPNPTPNFTDEYRY